MKDRYTLGVQIKQLSDIMAKNANLGFREYGLTMSQARFLAYIGTRKTRKVPLKELEAYFEVAQPTVAGITARLAKKGLVVMEKSEVNAAAKTISLTEKGTEVFRMTNARRLALEDWFGQILTEEECCEFSRLIEKVTNALRDAPPD
jgi:DNA-binding MarR family transcriptional regulator